MREIRTSGSEGGAAQSNASSLPLSSEDELLELHPREPRESKSFPDELYNRIGIRKRSRVQLGVNFLPVDRNFEGASTGGYQGEFVDFPLEFHELFRQTDGFRIIVSIGAVSNRDFHV